MEDLKLDCEKTFYKELYQLADGKQSLVIDETTQKVYLKKRLTIWQSEVLTYLKENTDPHIPQVQCFWEEDAELVVIEEYVQGETLADFLRRAVVTDEKKREILFGVMEGVAFLHHAKPPIIHRDIKPSNIMLTESGNVKLIDYDAAKIYHGEKKRDTVLLGTDGVAAPEQYGFAESDVRTDVYALGILIRELFPGDEMYERIAEKATQIDPAKRYQSVQELKAVLLRMEKPKKKRLPVVLSVVAACAAVCVGLLLYRILSVREPRNDAVQSETAEMPVAESNPETVSEVSESAPIADESTQIAQAATTREEYEPELLESGYGLTDSGEYKGVTFAAKVHNPDPEYAMKDVRVEVTVKAASGEVLASDYVRIRYIAADDTVYAAYDGVSWQGSSAAEVEIRLRHGKDDVVRQENSGIIYMDELAVSHVSEQDYILGGKEYLGEVTNNSESDLEEVGVFLILRKNGKLVGGSVHFVNDLTSGDNASFHIAAPIGYQDYDSYELYALQWTPFMST